MTGEYPFKEFYEDGYGWFNDEYLEIYIEFSGEDLNNPDFANWLRAHARRIE